MRKISQALDRATRHGRLTGEQLEKVSKDYHLEDALARLIQMSAQHNGRIDRYRVSIDDGTNIVELEANSAGNPIGYKRRNSVSMTD